MTETILNPIDGGEIPPKIINQQGFGLVLGHRPQRAAPARRRSPAASDAPRCLGDDNVKHKSGCEMVYFMGYVCNIYGYITLIIRDDGYLMGDTSWDF